MKRDDVPQGRHLAIPTKDTDEVHEGEYAHSCELCREKFRRQFVAPSWDGAPICVGDRIKVTVSGYDMDPEWGQVAEIHCNLYTGQVWMHTFEHSNRVLVQDDVLDVERESWMSLEDVQLAPGWTEDVIPDDRKMRSPRGKCRYCGRTKSLTKDGNLRKHLSSGRPCGGAGHRPS